MRIQKICAQLCLVALPLTLCLCQHANGQMEKRSAEHYLTDEFLEAFPAVGSELPEMTLQTLEGREVKLSSHTGKTLVLVKSGYT